MCGSFIKIKRVVEGRERYKEKEDEARTSLPLQKSSGKKRVGMGGDRLLKGPFAPAYIHNDIAATGL